MWFFRYIEVVEAGILSGIGAKEKAVRVLFPSRK